MPSPFPGMDPFLEGYLWSDVHQRLINVISELLGTQIGPKYVARINIYTVQDHQPEEEIGIMYPDVEIMKRNTGYIAEPGIQYSEMATTSITPASAFINVLPKIEVRVPFIEIRDLANNQLITTIEILSPVNKRGQGREKYNNKRKALVDSGVNVLEIDLVRRGKRLFTSPRVAASHYQMTLQRSKSTRVDIWTVDVKDKLPVLPVPLKSPDPDAVLDLGKSLAEVYRRGLFHLSINYQEVPPPPEFDEKDLEWMRELMKTVPSP